MTLENMRERILEVADSTLKFSRDLSIPSAEVYVYNQSLTNVSDNNGKIDSRDGVVQGVGIRVADGKKIGFSSCTGFADDSIKDALKNAFSMAKVSPDNPMFPGFATESEYSKEGLLDPDIYALDAEILSGHCDEIAKQINREDNRVVSVFIGTNSSSLGYAVGTTEGCLSATLSTSYTAFSYIVAMGDGDRKTGSHSEFGRTIPSLEGIGKTGYDKAIAGLGAKSFEGSEVLPTIWDSRNAAAFLFFPFLACTSGTTFVEKRNPWGEKIDQQIATKDFKLLDDAVNPENLSTHKIDSEGTPKGKTTIVDSGVLKTFLFNRMYGSAAGKQSTGNAQRQAPGGIPFESLPSSGPNQLVIENVGKSLDQQIEEVEKGILVTDTPIGLGTENPITGDFSVSSTNSFLILNGEIAHPLKAVSIAGNYHKSLMDIRTIGSDRERSGYPIDSPTITFMNHTISG
jgi:PmbA protein